MPRSDPDAGQSAITIEDLGELRQVEQAQLSPDGRQLACVVRSVDLPGNTYRSAIHCYATDGSGGRRLTAGPKDRMPSWSPDGRHLAFLRQSESGKPQLYLIDTAGGEAWPLTDMPRGVDGLAWSPDGSQLAIVSASDASERAIEDRVDAEPSSGADPEPTPSRSGDDRTRTEDLEAASDRHDPRVIDRLPFRSGTQFLEREQHLYVVDARLASDDGVGIGSVRAPATLPRPRRLTDGAASHALARWSPDGRWIFAWRLSDWDANDLFGAGEALALPAQGGPARRLNPTDQRPGLPVPSPCGRFVAWTCLPQGRSFSIGSHLVVADLDPLSRVTNEDVTGAAIDEMDGLPCLATTIAFDRVIEDFTWSPNGDALLLLAPDRGAVRLFRFDLAAAIASGATLNLDLDACAWPSPRIRPSVPHVTAVAAFDDPHRYVTSVDLRGGMLAATVSGPDHPADAFVLAMDDAAASSADDEARRLTAVSAAFLARRAMAPTQELWFEAPDGHSVQGWLLRPCGPRSADAPAPLLLEIHGGPHAMWGPGEPSMWHEFQVLAARGYAVFYCNPRGSDGYGRRHRLAIHRRWGFADEQDFLSGLDASLALGGLDAERIGVTGGSYGGYMTAWLIARHPRFRAAVSQRGVYDLVSFAGTTDIPRFTEEIFEVSFWEAPETLWRHSPLSQVAGIQAPLLILHAEQDYRVPIAGAEQLFAALKRLGRRVQLVRYPREGHELSRSGEPKHRRDRLERIVDWLAQHL